MDQARHLLGNPWLRANRKTINLQVCTKLEKVSCQLEPTPLPTSKLSSWHWRLLPSQDKMQAESLGVRQFCHMHPTPFQRQHCGLCSSLEEQHTPLPGRVPSSVAQYGITAFHTVQGQTVSPVARWNPVLCACSASTLLLNCVLWLRGAGAGGSSCWEQGENADSLALSLLRRYRWRN